MGRHIIAVSAEDIMTFRKVRRSLVIAQNSNNQSSQIFTFDIQGDYVFSHFYDIALVSVKLAILAFYYRVFAVPLFRKVVLATAAFTLCWGIAITVTLALVCQPIEAFWDDNVK